MRKNTNLTKIAELFKKEYKKILIFIYIAIAIFVAYGISVFFIIVFRINDRIIKFSIFLFILLTIILYYYFKKALKDKITKDNNNLSIYFLFAIVLIAGVITTFFISSYYIYKYFNTSVFDTDEYLKNYDIKAQNINKIFYPIIFAIGISIFLFNKIINLAKRGFNYSKLIVTIFDELLRLIFVLFFGFLIGWLLGIFAFTIFNLGYPG